MRILIAEDDATSRAVLAAVLKKGGHEVQETVDGAEAWAVLQQPGAPRMAILDWMMPKMDGVEVVRRARAAQDERPPYLIMLTAKGENTDIVTGLDAGADDYLTKPFDHRELSARVRVGQRVIEIQDALAAKITELGQALETIKTLRGIVPICAHCKKIRDDQGFWNHLESYVSQHTEAEFSHGFCPKCARELYPEFIRDEAE